MTLFKARGQDTNSVNYLKEFLADKIINSAPLTHYRLCMNEMFDVSDSVVIT